MEEIIVRRFKNPQDYQKTWDSMREFTQVRTPETKDEVWLLQHFPVFTLGQAGKLEHLLKASNIPLVKSDRGGQVTYHGPGQLIVYVLIDLKRRGLGVRDLVTLLEQSIIQLLSMYGIDAYSRKNAPGVYLVKEKIEHKIAALGLRVKKGCSYHGLSLNVGMDLGPFSQINPCGDKGLAITQLEDLLAKKPGWEDIENKLLFSLEKLLNCADD